MAVVAIAGVVLAFYANGGSSYVTMSQAQKMTSDDHLHLAGDLLKDSISQNMAQHSLQFKLRDQDGAIVDVVYKGEVPANMSEAAEGCVAILDMRRSATWFTSDKLLGKCLF